MNHYILHPIILAIIKEAGFYRNKITGSFLYIEMRLCIKEGRYLSKATPPTSQAKVLPRYLTALKTYRVLEVDCVTNCAQARYIVHYPLTASFKSRSNQFSLTLYYLPAGSWTSFTSGDVSLNDCNGF